MKTFYCDGCGSLVFFENIQCLKCQRTLGFIPELLDLSALEAADQYCWRALATSGENRLYRLCANSQEHQVCNWLVPVDDAEPHCQSCRLNEVIPNLADPANKERWFKLEQAKRRLIYTLLNLQLPLTEGTNPPSPRLHFRFLADSANEAVITGHQQGLITLNIAEADDPERERRRVGFHEPYRTLLGHLRHEVAHYYWDRLIANTQHVQAFRDHFGDETQDYAAALKQHYESGPPSDWQTRHVSAYASTHPWEDWAETWAHYLHIVDTLETAASFGLRLQPRHPNAQTMTADPQNATRKEQSFDNMLQHWWPLTYALNALNRGMGLPDLYPFVLSNAALDKVRFVHTLVLQSRGTSG
ncbi:MAG TPA: putative zinc-binding peptidase [Candidatus Acidoferrum sp.]|nr:putative zinc-binding peptidase [Candidatus Acidoferrum sp.]